MAGIYDLFCRRSQVTWLQVGLQTGLDLLLVLNATGMYYISLSHFITKIRSFKYYNAIVSLDIDYSCNLHRLLKHKQEKDENLSLLLI